MNQDASKALDNPKTNPIDYATLNRGSESPAKTKSAPDIVEVPPPYGNDWPSKASYIPGTLIENLGGNSSVKIDNSKNNYAVHIKLVDLKYNRRVREVYLPAFESFVIDALEQGNYDVRLKYLHSGEVQKTPRIELSESLESATVYELTLSKVLNGNLKLQTISEAEF